MLTEFEAGGREFRLMRALAAWTMIEKSLSKIISHARKDRLCY